MQKNKKRWRISTCLIAVAVFTANCASSVSVTAQNTTRPVLLGKIRNI